MIYLELKKRIKDEIIECYGSVAYFTKQYSQFSESGICQLLSPNHNSSLLKLKNICDILSLEIIVKRKSLKETIDRDFKKIKEISY